MSQKRVVLLTLLICAISGVIATSACLFVVHQPWYDPAVPVPFDIDMNAISIANRPSDAQLAFLGDSVTQRWLYRPEIWNRFGLYRPANLGGGGDKINNMLWRIEHGALDEIQPKAIVLLAGTNDVTERDPPFYKHANPSPASIANAIKVMIHAIESRHPQAIIILMGITPRLGRMQPIRKINSLLASISDLKVKYLDIGPELLGANGEIDPKFSVDGLHLTNAGYEVWAGQLSPILRDIFGY